MEHAPLRPVPARPAGRVEPATAVREVDAWLPTLPPLAAEALALVVLSEQPRAEVAGSLGVSEDELARLLAAARKELRQTMVTLGGSGWCERAEGLISDRLDGILAGRDTRRLDVHLRNCPRCVEHERRLVQATDALVGGVGGAARGPSPAGEAAPLVEAAPPDEGIEGGPEEAAPPEAVPRDGTEEAPVEVAPSDAAPLDAGIEGAPAAATPHDGIEEGPAEPAAHDEGIEGGPTEAAPPDDGIEGGPTEAAPPDDGIEGGPTEAAPPDDGIEGGPTEAAPPDAAPLDSGFEDGPAAAEAAPTRDQVAAAAEVLVASRTRRQLAAALVWNSMIALAILLTLATIALTIAGILGARL
jgi:Putative zinc-finger